jgi:hypothetical protein
MLDDQFIGRRGGPVGETGQDAEDHVVTHQDRAYDDSHAPWNITQFCQLLAFRKAHILLSSPTKRSYATGPTALTLITVVATSFFSGSRGLRDSREESGWNLFGDGCRMHGECMENPQDYRAV